MGVRDPSQEVGNHVSVIDDAIAVCDRVEDLEVVLNLLVNKHDRGNISATVTVVRRRPNSDQVGVLEPEFKAVHNELMGARNQIQAVDVVELGSDLGAEEPASPARRDGPCVDVIGVRPHQIAVSTFVRDLLSPLDKAHLVEGLDVGGETAVHAEDLAFNNGSNAQQVKHFGAVLPRVGVTILAHGLIVEAIDLGDLACLVISPQKRNVAWVLQFQAQQ